MKPYNPANLSLQPYSAFRVIILAWVGKLLGVQFKIDGIPYGADYDATTWKKFRGRNPDLEAASIPRSIS